MSPMLSSAALYAREPDPPPHSPPSPPPPPPPHTQNLPSSVLGLASVKEKCIYHSSSRTSLQGIVPLSALQEKVTAMTTFKTTQIDCDVMHQHPTDSACLQQIMKKVTHSLEALPALLSFSQMLALQLMIVSSKMSHSCKAVGPTRIKHNPWANHIPNHSPRHSHRARANVLSSPRHSLTAKASPNCNPGTRTRRNQAMLLST